MNGNHHISMLPGFVNQYHAYLVIVAWALRRAPHVGVRMERPIGDKNEVLGLVYGVTNIGECPPGACRVFAGIVIEFDEQIVWLGAIGRPGMDCRSWAPDRGQPPGAIHKCKRGRSWYERAWKGNREGPSPVKAYWE